MKFIEQIVTIFSLIFLQHQFSDSGLKSKIAGTWNIDPDTILGKPPADPPPADPPPTETPEEKAAREAAEKAKIDPPPADPPPADPPPAETPEEKAIREAAEKAKTDKNDIDDEDDPNDDILQFSEKAQISKTKAAKIAKRLRDEIGAEKFDAIPKDIQFTMIKKEIDIYIGSRSLNEKHQKNSQLEKNLEAERQSLEKLRTDIRTEKSDLDAKIKAEEDKKKNASKILEKNPDDIIDITEKTELIFDRRKAAETIENADKELENLQTKVAENTAKAQASVISGLLGELQASIPELQTVKDPVSVYATLKEELAKEENKDGLKRPLTDDEKRVLRMQDVLKRYLTSGEKDFTISQYYSIKKQSTELYPDFKLSDAQTTGDGKKGKPKVIDVKTAATATILADLFKQSKTDPPNPAGNTSSGTSTAKNGKDAFKGLTREQRLKKMGFTGADL